METVFPLLGILLFLLPGLVGLVWLDRWFSARRQRSLREMFLMVAYWSALLGSYAALFRWREAP